MHKHMILFLLALSILVLAPQPFLVAQASSNQATGVVQGQADPTAQPAPTAQAGQRKRLEAPPLRPQAAALLIGVNLAIAAGIVLLAWFLRRRQQRR